MSVETRQSATLPRPRHRSVWPLAVGSLAVAIVAAGGFLILARVRSANSTAGPSELPVLTEFPSFVAIREDGRRMTERDLSGSVWVADFTSTRCSSECLILSARMGELQLTSGTRLPKLKLVSFTIDPEYDTPERLAAFGRQLRANSTRWEFLNGGPDLMERVLASGIVQQTHGGDARDGGGAARSNLLVLVDANLRVRGFYRGTEAGVVDTVMRDAEAVSR